MEKGAITEPAKNDAIYGPWTDDFRTSVYLDLRNFQTDFTLPAFVSDTLLDWEEGDWLRDVPGTLRFIQMLRDLLTQEAETLRGGEA